MFLPGRIFAGRMKSVSDFDPFLTKFPDHFGFSNHTINDWKMYFFIFYISLHFSMINLTKLQRNVNLLDLQDDESRHVVAHIKSILWLAYERIQESVSRKIQCVGVDTIDFKQIASIECVFLHKCTGYSCK